MYGYLLMAAGGMTGFAAGMINATAFFGLTPLGWLTLLLIGVGAGLVLWLSSPPLEDWLNNGPFGGQDADQHMQEPQEAFYRLLSLLAGFSISIKANPLHEPNAGLGNLAVLPYPVRKADTVIRIESHLPGLVGSLGTTAIQAECRLCEVIASVNPGALSDVSRTVQNTATEPGAQRLSPDALELYVCTPPTQQIGPNQFRGYEWAVRAQFILSTPAATLHFPAPGVRDPIRLAAEHAKADFTRTNRPFWADEQTHKAK